MIKIFQRKKNLFLCIFPYRVVIKRPIFLRLATLISTPPHIQSLLHVGIPLRVMKCPITIGMGICMIACHIGGKEP